MNHAVSMNVAVNMIGQSGNKQSKNNWTLAKRKVFGPVVPTPNDVKPVGYKWVFVRKRDDKNEIVRYKARLVAQGFSQRPGIDYDKTYSLGYYYASIFN